MNDVVPALLAVLLVCASPAVVVAAGPSTGATSDRVDAVQSEHDEHNETTNRLGVDGETIDASPAPDLGATLANQDESMEREFRTFAIERRFERLESDDEGREAVEAAQAWIDGRIDAMNERERAVVERHAAGEASDAAVFRTLARNQAEARDLQRAVARLDELAEDVPDADVPARALEAELEVFTSPLRERINATVSGTAADGDSADFALETSPDGLAVSTLEDGRYVREAVRYDNRDESRTSQFDTLTDAYEAAEAFYPWAFENRESLSVNAYSPAKLYRVEVPHSQGDLTVYLDSGTGDVYHERQTLAVGQLPTVTNETTRNGSLAVTVERTPAGGPATITVRDVETGDPLEASVAVDGVRRGVTDSSGELVLLPPAGAFELTVRAGDESLNASVSAAG